MGGIRPADGSGPRLVGGPDQFVQGDVERVGDEEQVDEGGDGVPGLVPVDGLMVTADAFPEDKLGDPLTLAEDADAFPDLPAAGGYPVGHGVEWHPTTVE